MHALRGGFHAFKVGSLIMCPGKASTPFLGPPHELYFLVLGGNAARFCISKVTSKRRLNEITLML